MSNKYFCKVFVRRKGRDRERGEERDGEDIGRGKWGVGERGGG